MDIWTMFNLYMTCSVTLVYPWLLLIFDWIVSKDKTPESNEYRIKAGIEALKEYRMTAEINAMLKEMGDEPMDHRPIAESFHTRNWDMLKAICKEQVQRSINRIYGGEG